MFGTHPIIEAKDNNHISTFFVIAIKTHWFQIQREVLERSFCILPSEQLAAIILILINRHPYKKSHEPYFSYFHFIQRQ